MGRQKSAWLTPETKAHERLQRFAQSMKERNFEKTEVKIEDLAAVLTFAKDIETSRIKLDAKYPRVGEQVLVQRQEALKDFKENITPIIAAIKDPKGVQDPKLRAALSNPAVLKRLRNGIELIEKELSKL